MRARTCRTGDADGGELGRPALMVSSQIKLLLLLLCLLYLRCNILVACQQLRPEERRGW